ncbi:uncharacterized protein DFL_005352 [Arthrobotrys flagrans]|uniref:Uncharacterized protein n=1 Tax=Arthrobotrys flagrans TaxID=97331 RepID=A0A437A868_ARTFL|nr:hypothetical protein DFL_005352 [Arthrobotrys flagrans]
MKRDKGKKKKREEEGSGGQNDGAGPMGRSGSPQFYVGGQQNYYPPPPAPHAQRPAAFPPPPPYLHARQLPQVYQPHPSGAYQGYPPHHPVQPLLYYPPRQFSGSAGSYASNPPVLPFNQPHRVAGPDINNRPHHIAGSSYHQSHQLPASGHHQFDQSPVSGYHQPGQFPPVSGYSQSPVSGVNQLRHVPAPGFNQGNQPPLSGVHQFGHVAGPGSHQLHHVGGPGLQQSHQQLPTFGFHQGHQAPAPGSHQQDNFPAAVPYQPENPPVRGFSQIENLPATDFRPLHHVPVPGSYQQGAFYQRQNIPGPASYQPSSFSQGTAVLCQNFPPGSSAPLRLPPAMPPPKRVSTRDLAPAAGSTAQPQQLIRDPQASIASLAEAFTTPFSSRFQEGQLVGSSSTAPSSSPGPSTSKRSKKKKNNDKGKATTPSVPTILGQISGNRAGNPILVPNDEGDNTGKYAQGVVAGSAASAAREGLLAAVSSGREPSGPMSQAQLAYLKKKYEDEARGLGAAKGKEVVRESEQPSPVVVPAPRPLVPGQSPMLATALLTGGREMDTSRLANLQEPDPTAELVTRPTYPYWREGMLEEDPLGLGDIQLTTTTTPTSPRLPVAPMPSQPTGAEGSKEMALPSAGLINWDDEFSKTFGLVANEGEGKEENPTEEEWKTIAEAMRKGQEEPTDGLEAEASAVPSPIVINDAVGEEDERASPEETLGLPWLALDAEVVVFDPTDLTMWVQQLSLEHPGNPEELSLEELGAELDAYWDGVAQITSLPERIWPLERIPVLSSPPLEGKKDVDGDIELADQLATSPLTPLSVMSTPPELPGETPSSGVIVEVAIPTLPVPAAPRRRSKRGAQASPEGSAARPRTRSRTSQQQGSQMTPVADASITRRRSARISGASLPAESQPASDSSPPTSVTSEGRRSSRTNTSFIHRYHDTRNQSQGQGEGEEVDDDEVDMI